MPAADKACEQATGVACVARAARRHAPRSPGAGRGIGTRCRCRAPGRSKTTAVPVGGADRVREPPDALAAEVGPGVGGRVRDRPLDLLALDQDLHRTGRLELAVDAALGAQVRPLQVERSQAWMVPAGPVAPPHAVHDAQLREPLDLARRTRQGRSPAGAAGRSSGGSRRWSCVVGASCGDRVGHRVGVALLDLQRRHRAAVGEVERLGEGEVVADLVERRPPDRRARARRARAGPPPAPAATAPAPWCPSLR